MSLRVVGDGAWSPRRPERRAEEALETVLGEEGDEEVLPGVVVVVRGSAAYVGRQDIRGLIVRIIERVVNKRNLIEKKWFCLFKFLG